MQKRRFHRLAFSAPAQLSYHGITYSVRWENICLGGALFSSSDFLMIAPGESCSVSLPALEGEAPLMITAEVVHSFFSMAGVKFVAFAEGAQHGLYQLLQRLTTDPERLAQEWEQLHSAEPALTLPLA